mgnify:CR=1 FL=1
MSILSNSFIKSKSVPNSSPKKSVKFSPKSLPNKLKSVKFSPKNGSKSVPNSSPRKSMKFSPKSLPNKLDYTKSIIFKKSPQKHVIKKGSQSAQITSPKKMNKFSPKSLPMKLNYTKPITFETSLDKIFWEEYTPDKDISTYVRQKIKQYHLSMSKNTSSKGSLCKMDKTNLKLFNYQLVQTILGSPYSPLKRLLIIASTGTGKTCTMVGIVNYHIRKNIKDKKKYGIIFVGATHELFTNFIKQSMECPGDMKQIANENGWTDVNDENHTSAFTKYIKQYIYPLNYTELGNLISGKYKKYEKIDNLSNKLIVMDEVHYLVDSVDKKTYKPNYERMPESWRVNLKYMFNLFNDRNSTMLKNTTIIGATATPITSSIMEYFLLVNMFARNPLSTDKMKMILKSACQIETSDTFSHNEQQTLNNLMEMMKPNIKDSVVMYIAKKPKQVLDTSIFPQMEFQTVPVLLSESQRNAILKKL